MTDIRCGRDGSPRHILTTDELLDALRTTFAAGGGFPLEITGRSMRPLLRHGRDTVWLRPFRPETCKRGSILLYQRPNGRLVLHRVRRCMAGGYLMNGDAQTACEIISAEQVAAQAERICRGTRSIDCDAPGLRLWDALWYPTRPVRPLLFRIGRGIRRLFPEK